MADKTTTSVQALAAWDLKQPVWTVAMGGERDQIGAYAQKQASVMFDILRGLLAYGLDFNRMPDLTWNAAQTTAKTARLLSGAISESELTQMAVLAGNIYEHGYATVLSRVDPSRHILVQKP